MGKTASSTRPEGCAEAPASSPPTTTSDRKRVVFGIEFDHSGRANAEARLKCADLQALLADPEHGIGPDRTRRTWLDAPGVNDTKEHREHLLTLADACTWRGVSETDWSWSGQIERMALPHLPSRLIAAVGFGQGHRIDQMVADRPDEPGLAVAPQFAALSGMRSLEAGGVVEAYVLVTGFELAPVLVRTRPIDLTQPIGGARTPCHNGRHEQCRGRYGHGDEGNCQCRCGCTDPCRGTIAANLTTGDRYSLIRNNKRLTVRSRPDPVLEERVQFKVLDRSSGTEFIVTEQSDQLVKIHNPPRRRME